VSSLIFYLIFLNKKTSKIDQEYFQNQNYSSLNNLTCNSSKWIIISSINKIENFIFQYSKLSDWNIVIVGDKKLKVPNVGELKNFLKVHFLSLETNQLNLGFKISTFLKSNHYTRKNIGYLYAIRNGAKIILDTDDDNFLKDTNEIYYRRKVSIMDHYANYIGVVNPYEYFGHREIYPRGLPLCYFKKLSSEIDPYICPKRKSFSPIQQYLQDLNPDIDSIIRLTQSYKSNYFKFSSVGRDSIALPVGVFAPFNSRNTIFHEEAFWGLLLPTTVTSRVCDIWRSYWSQRLLWDIGGKISFGKSTVDHLRNSHNLLDDYKDEKMLFEDSRRLIIFLKEWKSDEPLLKNRIITLAREMYENGFWEINDYDLIKCWIEDLESIGYKFPEIRSSINEFNINEWCNPNNKKGNKQRVLSKIIGICFLTFPQFMFPSVNFFQLLYASTFPNLKFYVDFENNDKRTKFTYQRENLEITYIRTRKGWFSPKVLEDAVERYPNYKGYFYFHDDIFLFPWNFRDFDYEKIYAEDNRFGSAYTKYNKNYIKRIKTLPKKYKESLQNCNYKENTKYEGKRFLKYYTN
jgi:hypothetical protein